MRWFREKCEKHWFLGILGQKGQFWTSFDKKGAIFEFSVKKRKRHFFTHFFSIFQYKKSENSNAQIFGEMGTYVRTYTAIKLYNYTTI